MNEVKIASVIKILTLLLFISCNRNSYLNPISKLYKDRIENSGDFIYGRFDPLNEIIEYSYSLDSTKILDGPFVWNRNYKDETVELSKFLMSNIFASANYISGNFLKGKLDGNILLMRIYNKSIDYKIIDTIGYFNYNNGVLDGPFLISNNQKINYKGRYLDGNLEGKLYHRERFSTVNGIESLGGIERILNYSNGKYDSIQVLKINDEIKEEMNFENGRLIDINKQKNIKGMSKLKNNELIYNIDTLSLYYSLIGRMFELDHTSRIRNDKFGDSSFLGSIKFCNGYLCNSKFEVDRFVYDNENDKYYLTNEVFTYEDFEH